MTMMNTDHHRPQDFHALDKYVERNIDEVSHAGFQRINSILIQLVFDPSSSITLYWDDDSYKAYKIVANNEEMVDKL